MSDARSAVVPRAEALADAAITADRAETKYLLDGRRVRAFVQLAQSQLAVHRFVGEGANQLPDPQNFVTSIYFDTADHQHFRAAVADAEHNVKVRAREYYDLMPSLAELATDPGQIVRYQPWVWFEVKQREQGRSRKLRFRLDRREVPAFFRGEHAAFTGDSSDCVELSSIVSFLRSLSVPLQPSCIVNYRRLALQDASASVRVTVDLQVGYYPAPSDLWTRSHALVRGTFGVPKLAESSALVEVKCRGAAPPWLGHELDRLGARPVSYSKFVHAARAVHG